MIGKEPNDEEGIIILEGGQTGPEHPAPFWLDVEGFERIQYPGSQCPDTHLHVTTTRPRIGINTILPKAPIHIIIGRDEFTDADIREWAKGNLESIDWRVEQRIFLIEYLSQIIVNQVLDRE